MNEKIFRKASIDRISSPDQLNDYIKVSNPSVWLTLGAILVLLTALLVWGIFGTLPTRISVKGLTQSDGIVVCYIPQEYAGKVKIGMSAEIDSAKGVISEVGKYPVSMEEAESTIEGDYFKEALQLSDWNVKIVISIDTKELNNNPEVFSDNVHDVSIIEQEIRPIDFLFN